MNAPITVIVSLLVAIFSLLLPTSPAFSQTAIGVISITRDDMKASEIGQEIAEMNDKIRGFARDSKLPGIGPDSREVLAGMARSVREERDRIGEPIRGLDGHQVTAYSSGISGAQIVDLIAAGAGRCTHAWVSSGGSLRCEMRPPSRGEVVSEMATGTDRPGGEGAPSSASAGGDPTCAPNGCCWRWRGAEDPFGLGATGADKVYCYCGRAQSDAGMCAEAQEYPPNPY
ncbi:MAG: hypothetical protein RIC89_04895 [Pseudomonadales bacterium]